MPLLDVCLSGLGGRNCGCRRWSGNWSLTSLPQRLVKTGGRLIEHTCYEWRLLAESHLTRLFEAMVRGIDEMPVPARVARDKKRNGSHGGARVYD